MTLKMDAGALQTFLDEQFEQVARDYIVEEAQPMAVRVRLQVGEHNLRPGGTISGPAMFALADVGVYLAILAMIGPVALAVTTGASIDFMRKPQAGRDLIGKARLLKLGRALAVGDVLIRSEGSDEIVARASVTYSIPPAR
ncbi:MAG: PaaI family thioesterase [Alphaproteobacteria bacterium]|nr:PaaI family thioesterase [Alphaproteobacteria bacterium]